MGWGGWLRAEQRKEVGWGGWLRADGLGGVSFLGVFVGKRWGVQGRGCGRVGCGRM